MELTPLISIVMPVHNCEQYIEDSIKSVERQTYKNWELIVIDDKSDDGTWEILQKCQNENGKIKIFRNEENSGVAGTRNRGIQLSQGEWVAFLDSDDIWRLDKLDEQIRMINRRKDVSLTFTSSGFIDKNGNEIPYIFHVPKTIMREQLLKQNVISCSSVVVKKTLIQKHPFPTEKDIHEDFVVWLQILEEVVYAWGVDKPLLLYRLSDSSKSANKIKAAKMNWNAYRAAGLNVADAAYYMAFYAVNGIKKYKTIRNMEK